MTTTTQNTSPWGGHPSTTGTNDADTKAKAKAALEANTKIEKKKEVKKIRQKKKNSNINQTRYGGLVTDHSMKGVTISPGSSGNITLDFRQFKKSGIVYAAAKGYKHWTGGIKQS